MQGLVWLHMPQCVDVFVLWKNHSIKFLEVAVIGEETRWLLDFTSAQELGCNADFTEVKHDAVYSRSALEDMDTYLIKTFTFTPRSENVQ